MTDWQDEGEESVMSSFNILSQIENFVNANILWSSCTQYAILEKGVLDIIFSAEMVKSQPKPICCFRVWEDGRYEILNSKGLTKGVYPHSYLNVWTCISSLVTKFSLVEPAPIR